jgi:hypothetical protein
VIGWAAILDGDIAGADLRATRAAARADAAWLRRHPACRDRARFGHGGSVRVVRVERCAYTGKLIEAGGAS